MRHVIELADVGITRGRALLLDGVSWTVDAHERWVVIGANGAGKSTLLQVVGGRMFPSQGVAGVLGEVLGTADVRELRPRIGMASASIADHIPATETARDVVMTAAYGVVGRAAESYEDVDVDRADRMLADFGLADRANRSYLTLSEGERKRVHIARALMTDPELLLLDEPAAGLDIAGREQVVRQLHRLAVDPGAPTMVLVTHHVEDIPPGFTHALVLRAGAVVAQGPLRATLTTAVLTQAFDIPISVEERDGRWTARAAMD